MSNYPIQLDIDAQGKELEQHLLAPRYQRHVRFVIAALSSIPWVGGVIGASAAFHAEGQQGRANELVCRWLEEHRRKITVLGSALEEIIDRVEQLGPEAETRLSDDKYLSLVRHGFHIWDAANIDSKREYVRRTLTNAAATTICSDDLVRMFLEWIDRYDETHFRIIRVLFHKRGATRGRIWDEIGGASVREDSAEADLFKLLIFDLNTGHVLRQIRQTNDQGQFLAMRRTGRTGGRLNTLESAFEDTKPYELTAMGEQFATFVLNETVPRLGQSA